jgi:7-keto-8-aminopelargonate synthetase-like enzyme
MLLNFGYQGIMSCIDALVNRRDVIVYDAEAHACIVDGVRLHMGNRFAFKERRLKLTDNKKANFRIKLNICAKLLNMVLIED